MAVETAAPSTKQVARRRRFFSKQDKVTLGFFIGIPTFLHVALVWFPAIATIGLSFTYWTGIRIEDIAWAGLSNYENIFLNTPIFWDALRNNTIWILWFFFIATPLGVLLAYQIDREIRGHKIYQ